MPTAKAGMYRERYRSCSLRCHSRYYTPMAGVVNTLFGLYFFSAATLHFPQQVTPGSRQWHFPLQWMVRPAGANRTVIPAAV
jgi:thiosulfate reductase cytochrome b subunit